MASIDSHRVSLLPAPLPPVNTKMLLAGWGACGIPVSAADNTYKLAVTDAGLDGPNGNYFYGGGESPSRQPRQARHLNGNRRSVSSAGHSINQWAIGLSRDPFNSSVPRVPKPSSVFLTSTTPHGGGSADAKDPEKVDRLWEILEEQTGVSYSNM